MMMKNGLILLSILILGISCSKDEDPAPVEEPFDVTDYFVGGTITPASRSYTSVFFIKLLEDNKAAFVSTGNDLVGDYRLTDDSLIVSITDPNNAREARFALNERHEVTSAYYKALTMEYQATGALLKIEDENQFAGKTFGGQEYKMGPSVNKENWYYIFNASGSGYGSGEDPDAIESTNTFENINNRAFKYVKDDAVELGFVSGDSLTVFRYQGLYYFGTYKQQ